MPDEPIEFDNLLNKFININNDKRERTRKEMVFYASEIGYCPRKIWYSFKSPEKHGADTLKIMRIGTTLHEDIQNIFKTPEMKEIFKNEMGVTYVDIESRCTIPTQSFSISGRIDARLLTKDTIIPVEFKSIKGITTWLKKPYWSHLVQLNLYLYAENAKYGYLIYIDKINMKLKSFKVEIDHKLINNVMGKMYTLTEQIKQGVLPEPISEDWSNFMCTNCEYKNKCKKHFNPTKVINKLQQTIISDKDVETTE